MQSYSPHFYSSSVSDIAVLVLASYSSSTPLKIPARGRSHSTHGQALVLDGVVIQMSPLNCGGASRINVSTNPDPYCYADVGGERLWNDVLQATLQHGLTPVSWTDYLDLTVGGTLSNAGISGQAFRHGPQISNVYELDVVTGNLLQSNPHHLSQAPSMNIFPQPPLVGPIWAMPIKGRVRIEISKRDLQNINSLSLCQLHQIHSATSLKS